MVFRYHFECYVPSEDVFRPPCLSIGGLGVGLLNRKTWPPKVIFVVANAVAFPYDEHTGNYVNPTTYRGDPYDYDIDESTSDDE